MFEAIVAVKWKQDAGTNMPDFSVSLKSGEAWEDFTGNYHPAPIYLIRIRLNTRARLQVAQGMSNIIVLAWREVNEDSETVDGNYDDKPTATQLTTLGNLILSTFPNTDADMLKENGQKILKNGLTRWQIVKKLATRFGRL